LHYRALQDLTLVKNWLLGVKLQSYVIGAGKTGALAAVSATVNGQADGDAHANGASAAAAKAMVKTADALSGAAGECGSFYAIVKCF
jgi:hypothetical protein